MKTALICLAVLLTLPLEVCAQVHHTDLSWTASADAGVAYNVYKAIGACPSTGLPSGATKIASAITKTAYSDNAVSPGQTACYYVTATLNGSESAPSNTAPATTPIAPPGTLTIQTVAELRVVAR